MPSESDWSALRERMEIITQWILKKNFVAFADAEVEMHIPHKYSVESSLKSQIVSLHEKFCIMNHFFSTHIM